MALSKFKLPGRSLLSEKQKFKLALRRRPAGAPEVPAERALDMWEEGFAAKAALQHFENEGLQLPDRPAGDPVMPEDITSLPSVELGMLYGHFVAYVGFLEGRVALADARAEEAESYRERLEAEVRLRKTGTVPDKNAKALNDPQSVRAAMKALEEKAKSKLLRAHVRGYERCANALSREMTRRGLPASE